MSGVVRFVLHFFEVEVYSSEGGIDFAERKEVATKIAYVGTEKLLDPNHIFQRIRQEVDIINPLAEDLQVWNARGEKIEVFTFNQGTPNNLTFRVTFSKGLKKNKTTDLKANHVNSLSKNFK